MNTKESLPHALGRKALDAMIRREYDGWPPKTQWSLCTKIFFNHPKGWYSYLL